MTPRHSFPTLRAVILLYLISHTNAVLPPTCERVTIATAVNCACYLYRPLYESNPIWRGLENLCSKELSGNITAGKSSCESAPFHVSSSAPERVQVASILAADRFFKTVERHCVKFIAAEEKLRRAKQRLAKADNKVEANRARSAKRSALDVKRNAREGLKSAREERYRRVSTARRKEWPQRRRQEYLRKQRQSHAQNNVTSPSNPSSKSVSRRENQPSRMLTDGNSSVSDMLRPVSLLKMLWTVRLETQKVLKRFCNVTAIFHGMTVEETEALCCAND